MTTMRERIARAVWESSADTRQYAMTWEELVEAASRIDWMEIYQRLFRQADAVLAAMEEPTEAMTIEGEEFRTSSIADARMIWRAMIHAAWEEKS